jgi:hypothetical protein
MGDEFSYNFNNDRRGIALLIHNEEFDRQIKRCKSINHRCVHIILIAGVSKIEIYIIIAQKWRRKMKLSERHFYFLLNRKAN